MVHVCCIDVPFHSRHTSKRRRFPMPASPRRRARCNRHEARVGIVALISCCLVRLSNGGLRPPGENVSLPACTMRRICRGSAPASRLDPLAISVAIIAAAAKLFFRCAQRNIYYRSRTCQFFMRPREPGLRTKHLRDSRKRHHLRSHQLSRSRSTGFPHAWRTTFATLRTRLVTTTDSLL